MLTDPVRDWPKRIKIVGALGEVQGPVGSAVIRNAFADATGVLPTARPGQPSWPTDLACAAVYALCKRDGAAATDIFAAAAFHSSRAISRYGAAKALAAIEYLASHAEPGTGRAIRLVTLVRDRWRNIGGRT